MKVHPIWIYNNIMDKNGQTQQFVIASDDLQDDNIWMDVKVLYTQATKT